MKGAELAPQDPAIDEHVFTANGTWVWELLPNVSWANAARFTHLAMDETGTVLAESPTKNSDFSHVINAWSASSDIVYKATGLDSIRAGINRGVQFPSLINSGYDLFQNFGPSYSPYLSYWAGNPDLKPTVVTNYSADYTRKLPEVSSNLKLGVFYEVNKDIVSPLQLVGTVTINGTSYPYGTSINAGGSKGYGGEVQLKGSSENGLRWNTSYSFTRVTDDQGVTPFVYYQGSAPQHHFRLGLGYSTGPWELDGNTHLVSSTNMLRSPNGGYDIYPMKKNGYAAFNGRIGYKITDNITAALSGTNLTRKFTGTSPYPAIERQVFLNLTGRF